jgi:hypothetical protein
VIQLKGNPLPRTSSDSATEQNIRSLLRRKAGSIGLKLLKKLLSGTTTEVELDGELELGFGLEVDTEGVVTARLGSESKALAVVVEVDPETEEEVGMVTPDFKEAWVNTVTVSGVAHIKAPLQSDPPRFNRTCMLRIETGDDDVELTWDEAYHWPDGDAPGVSPFSGARHFVSLWLDPDGSVAAVMPPEFLATPRVP